MPDSDFRRELAQQLRVDLVRASAAAGSGHPTSSTSTADVIAVLVDGYPTLDFRSRPKGATNTPLPPPHDTRDDICSAVPRGAAMPVSSRTWVGRFAWSRRSWAGKPRW